MEVITLGETLAVLVAVSPGPLRYSSHFELRTGGAETNFAVGMTRLGHPSGWISRLGDDEFGRLIYTVMRGEGVDVTQVKFERGAPTGVFFKERREAGESRNSYYRSNSAATRLSPADIDPAYFEGARLLHITGITPLLSSTCQAAVETAIGIAKQQGVLVSFDPNIRLKLRPCDEAAPILSALMRKADIVMPNIEEARLLVGDGETEHVIRRLESLGSSIIALKLGQEGAVILEKGRRVCVPGFPIGTVVDPFGAGDAFAAGFLAGILEGKDLYAAGRMGNAAGAMALTVSGNIEALLFREELDAFLAGQKRANR
jgi:2-dehydro-3-deoxygluconokinase